MKAYKNLFKRNIFVKCLSLIAIANFVSFFIVGSLNIESKYILILVDTTVISLVSAAGLWKFVWRPFQDESLNYFASAFHIIEQKLNAIEQVAVISICDEKGKITFANKKFIEISGYSMDELLGKEHSIVNSGFHAADFFNLMWKTIRAGCVWNGEIRNHKKNGQFYWVSTYIMPLFDNQNNIVNYISIGFDITGQKQMESELEVEKKKSIHMARLSTLGEMAANIAHEINNPLALISGALMLISENAQKPKITEIEREKIIDFSGRADFQAQRLTKIVKSLRGFARGNAEYSDMRTVRIDDLVDCIKTLCYEKLHLAQVELKYHPCDFTIQCHQIQIEQVLVNLVNNAVDAIAESPKPWIFIGVEKQGDYLMLKVRDSGPRISDEILEKMATPYFTTKEIGKGTGLGLSISKTIISNHKGTLYVDKEDSNTCFVIKLPHILRKQA